VDQLPLVRPRSRIRAALERVSLGLIAYGILGLLVAALGLGLLSWTASAFGSFETRVDSEADALAGTLRRTADSIDEAAGTAESFGRTLDETPPGVRQAAAAIRNLQPRLIALQQQASGINILGSRPLQGIGDLFGQMATDLEGLDVQLDRIADELGGNREALTANAASLAALADEVDGFADRLDGGAVSTGLGEMRTILALVVAVLVLLVAVPAIGALVAGLWIRRELGPRRPRVPLVIIER
jgi:methyl-accepting chemotaxis protein